ncbi:hypothetical protein [Candidatus Amarolinea dominans]
MRLGGPRQVVGSPPQPEQLAEMSSQALAFPVANGAPSPTPRWR